MIVRKSDFTPDAIALGIWEELIDMGKSNSNSVDISRLTNPDDVDIDILRVRIE